MQTLQKIKYVKMEKQWHNQGFLVNDKKVNNHSTIIDICNAFKNQESHTYTYVGVDKDGY